MPRAKEILLHAILGMHAIGLPVVMRFKGYEMAWIDHNILS
jgi:hypothetical protein